MQKEVPVISIVMPTYNRVELLKRALKSIQEQTLTDWELIVINDASKDDTKHFLDLAAQKDSRIHPIHNLTNNYPDISKTLNKGLEVAQGKYIARLDDDDYWCDSEKLQKQVDYLKENPDYVVIGGGTIVIDENDNEKFRYEKIENDGAIRNKALFANPFTHSTVMFNRVIAIAVGGYGDFKNAEDWDLWLKMGTKGKFYNSQDYFVRYLLTDKSKTFIFKRSQSKEILRLINNHKDQYPNFTSAYALNTVQYCYSLFPLGFQRSLHGILSRAKRSIFS